VLPPAFYAFHFINILAVCAGGRQTEKAGLAWHSNYIECYLPVYRLESGSQFTIKLRHEIRCISAANQPVGPDQWSGAEICVSLDKFPAFIQVAPI